MRSSLLSSDSGSSTRRVRVRTLRRRQLQHIILEVGERFALTEVFVIGSSAILAVLPDPPEGALTSTRDVDIIPPNDDDERIAAVGRRWLCGSTGGCTVLSVLRRRRQRRFLSLHAGVWRFQWSTSR